MTGALAPALRARQLVREGLWGLILVLAVALVYHPVRYAGFIWDDDGHLTANPAIVGPLGFRDIWTAHSADIAPLTRSTLWLGHWLWGLEPAPFHFLNVALHAVCAILLWRALRRLSVPGAWLGAAVWALHPVQVESVAWISEMKNTESGIFFLLTVLCFLSWLKSGRGRVAYYALMLLCGALAMAAKSSTVILPLSLYLCAWWVEGERPWADSIRRFFSLVPVLALSAVMSVQSMWSTGAMMSRDVDPQPLRTIPERMIGAGYAIWFYLSKLFWPVPQMAIYPKWEIAAAQASAWAPLLAAIVLLVVMWRARNSWARPYFFCAAWFAIALLPVLGIVDHYELRYSLVFDHFQYLAAMGPLALVGALVTRLPDSLPNFTLSGRTWLRIVVCAGLLTVEAGRSWQRVWVFQSEETLWTDTLAHNPECWAAHYNLANALLKNGRSAEAVAHYQTTLELHPGYIRALTNLGTVLAMAGNLNSALVHFREAVQIDPAYAVARNDLGMTLARLGRLDDAIAEFRSAIRIEPGYQLARDNLEKAEALARQRVPVE